MLRTPRDRELRLHRTRWWLEPENLRVYWRDAAGVATLVVLAAATAILIVLALQSAS